MSSPAGNITCDGFTSPGYVTGIFVMLSVIGILTAMLGNSLIFVAVYKTHSLRTPAYYLLASLSLASLMFVPVLTSYTVSLAKTECKAKVTNLCRWTSRLEFALFCVVMDHLVVISLDRLVAIKRPLRYATIMTKRRTLVIITILWIAGGIGGTIPGIFHVSQGKQGKVLIQLVYGCIQNNIIPPQQELKSIVPHFLFLMSVTVLLPSSIMLFAHAWIFMISRSQYRRIRAQGDAVSNRRFNEMRAAKTVAVTVFSALACFTPHVVVDFITAFEPLSGKELNSSQIKIKYILFPSLKILYLLAIALNPLICALKTRAFKETFKRILHVKQLPASLNVSSPVTNYFGITKFDSATAKRQEFEINAI